jgi:hypothetical protein
MAKVPGPGLAIAVKPPDSPAYWGGRYLVHS